MLSDRLLAVNISCSHWQNRTYRVQGPGVICPSPNGQSCIPDANCRPQTTPNHIYCAWAPHYGLENYYCAEQRVSWEGTKMVFDQGLRKPGESRAEDSCFSKATKLCGSQEGVTYTGNGGDYYYNIEANELHWHIPTHRSGGSEHPVYGMANLTLQLSHNASAGGDMDTQGKHVAAEWTYAQGGKVVPELHHLGVLAGHDRSKDYVRGAKRRFLPVFCIHFHPFLHLLRWK